MYRGAKVIAKCIDVRNEEEMRKFIHQVDDEREINLIIANAGVSGGKKFYDEIECVELLKHLPFEEKIQALVSTNLNGTLNTILPAITRFQKRKSGQVVLISSLTALLPLLSDVYGCTKRCVLDLGNVLRMKLANDNVNVNVVCPGLVIHWK